MLVPAALSNQLNESNAEAVKARIILELANAPTTSAADDIFFKRDIMLVPDILANAGGVVVSYFEWSQNLSNDTWPEAKVLDRLQKIMITAFSSLPLATAPAAFIAARCDRLSPIAPSAPTSRKSRRVIPSQVVIEPLPVTLSITGL